jgi:probable F420-dependent oxidoreductase
VKFGFNLPTEPEQGAREPLRRTYEVAARAEELGFDFGVVPHHRFTSGYPLSPWVALAAVAARTTSLRLGTNIMLLPLDHPLDVAEELASLDQVSGGRAFIGAGLGYRRYEYDALQIPYSRRGSRMSECLDILEQAMTKETFSFHGEHFDFDDVSVVPRPVQQPRPTMWCGANSDAGVSRAAQRADGWLAGFGDKLPALQPRVAAFREESAANGRAGTVCLLRLIGVGASREAVEENWLPGVVDMLRSYRRAGAPGERNETASRALGERATPGLDAFQDMLIGGSPEDVIAEIERCREMLDCDYVLPTFRGPDADEHLELFGREVIPAFADG